jgi:protein-S-isoprenylcysteine O-methyltransferase Ste14
MSILLSKFLFPHWKKEALDEFLDALGIGIVLFGFLFRIAARGYKAEMAPFGKRLIRGGLYGLVRHPMYFGTLLIGLGIVLVLFKWWVFLLFFLTFLLIYIPQIHREEDKLYKRFGNEYQNYRERTPKYFPDIFGLFKIDLWDYLFFKWSWLKKEIPSLILVTGGIIAIEIWEDIRLFGHEEFIKELLELSLIIAFFVIISFSFYKKEGFSIKY